VKQSAASAVLSRILVSADVMTWTVMNMRRSVKIMRLIDADKLIHALCRDYATGKKTLGQVIDDQPTAFDVDEVVKQLDKASDYYEFDEQGKEHVQMINLTEAIEIVKGGGI
jgi:hypothetical protein